MRVESVQMNYLEYQDFKAMGLIHLFKMKRQCHRAEDRKRESSTKTCKAIIECLAKEDVSRQQTHIMD